MSSSSSSEIYKSCEILFGNTRLINCRSFMRLIEPPFRIRFCASIPPCLAMLAISSFSIQVTTSLPKSRESCSKSGSCLRLTQRRASGCVISGKPVMTRGVPLILAASTRFLASLLRQSTIGRERNLHSDWICSHASDGRTL